MNMGCFQGMTECIQLFPIQLGPRDDPVPWVAEIHLVQAAFILLEVGLHRISSVKMFVWVCFFLIYCFYCCSVTIVPIFLPIALACPVQPLLPKTSPTPLSLCMVPLYMLFNIMSLLSADSTGDDHARLLYSLQYRFLTTFPHLCVS